MRGILGTSQERKEGEWGYGGGVFGVLWGHWDGALREHGDMGHRDIGTLGWSSKGTLRVGDMGMGI